MWILVSFLSVFFAGCLGATGDGPPNPAGDEAGDVATVPCMTINGLEYRCEARPPGSCYMRSNDLEIDCVMERLVEVTLIDEAFAIGPDGGSSYEVEVPQHMVRGAWSIELELAAVKALKVSGTCPTTFQVMGTVLSDTTLRHDDVLVGSGGTISAECEYMAPGPQTIDVGGLGIAQGQVVLTGLQVQLVDPAWAFDAGEDGGSA